MARKRRNYTERAIELAIAGGWEHNHLAPGFFKHKNMVEWKKYTIYHPDPKIFFLDPKFWQALQRAIDAKEPKHCWEKIHTSGMRVFFKDWFENTMHSFMDHMISAQPMESFFEELLTHHKAKL